MPLGLSKADEKPYASCEIVPTSKKSNHWPEEAIRRISDKYDTLQYHSESTSGSGSGSDSLSSSSIDTSELTEEERLKIEICFRGLKTQVFVCSSMANVYFSEKGQEGSWQLRYTGVPVVVLDSGETKSRNKRRIKMLLAERGTCFTMWQDTIDNLSAYKVEGHAFHTMFLSSDHRKIVGLSFDYPDGAHELWLHIERLTSCPENISLSIPGVKNKSKKVKKSPPRRLPEKSTISQPCCFQHVTSVDLNDKSRYFSMQTMLAVLPATENASSHL